MINPSPRKVNTKTINHLFETLKQSAIEIEANKLEMNLYELAHTRPDRFFSRHGELYLTARHSRFSVVKRVTIGLLKCIKLGGSPGLVVKGGDS